MFVVFQLVDPEWNLTSLSCSAQRWRSAVKSHSRMKLKAQSAALGGPGPASLFRALALKLWEGDEKGVTFVRFIIHMSACLLIYRSLCTCKQCVVAQQEAQGRHVKALFFELHPVLSASNQDLQQ